LAQSVLVAVVKIDVSEERIVENQLVIIVELRQGAEVIEADRGWAECDAVLDGHWAILETKQVED
jgi:hypothetical protein